MEHVLIGGENSKLTTALRRALSVPSRGLPQSCSNPNSRLGNGQGRSGQRCNDLFSVKSTILDEDLTRIITANHNAREIQSWHIALETFRIKTGLIGVRIECNAQFAEEREIGVITR